MEFRALLLDLDGTLIDTAPDMVGALNRLLDKHDKPQADYQQASQLVSNGGRALIEYGFGSDLNNEQTNALVQEFLSIYQQHVCVDSRMYDGMGESLEYCEANNISWGVITNKPVELAKGVLDGLGLLQRCKILLGGDSLPVKKPDPVPMLHACMLLNVAPSQCLYVGDHVRDIDAGNAAGMDSAAALWGYIQPQDDYQQWGAKYFIRQPSGLFNLIQDLTTL